MDARTPRRPGARSHEGSGPRALLRGIAAALAGGAVLPVTLAAQAPGADAVLDHAVASLGRVTTLRADFTQRIHDPMLGSDETSTGELLIQRPGKFAMRWRRPAGDLILQDGQALWVYLPSTAPHQAVRTDLTRSSGQSVDFLQEFLDRPRERFTVAYVRADSVGTRAADVLSLVPHDTNAPYQRVLIWVDREDGLPRRFEISEGSGAVRRITLDRLRVNAPIPASSFVFKPPAGVRIVNGGP
jgi:outer membrane lipoprotein carrier protein